MAEHHCSEHCSYYLFGDTYNSICFCRCLVLITHFTLEYFCLLGIFFRLLEEYGPGSIEARYTLHLQMDFLILSPVKMQ